MTGDSIRQDWPGVLEMIKAKRRVTWMMLQNASVVSLDENILTLRFPRQGDVKGFTAGKYDDVVKQALNARYGVNLVVRAISGPDTSAGGGGSRRPAPPVPPRSDAPWPDEPPPDEDDPAASQSGAPPRWSEERGARDEGRGTREGGGSERRGTPFDPDDEESSAPVSAELTGVGLIQRELGGEVISEVED